VKTLILKIFAAALFTAALAGCGTVQHESAMEWMERQPWTSDTPN
jgi:hypothetical protein